MIKNKINNTSTCVAILLVFGMFLSSCQHTIQSHKKSDNNDDNAGIESNETHEYQLSDKICQTVFGIDPQTFCEKNGKDTLLENGFTSAMVTSDDTLVLQLTNIQSGNWRNSEVSLQILQKILGSEKEIVSKIIPPTDSFYGAFYENADTACGFEISDDYSKVTAGPGDDKSYQLIVSRACLLMQVFKGIPSDNISVEYIELDSEGVVTNRIFLPMYMFIFENLDECKQLKTYEQISSEIDEYLDPNVDENLKGLNYISFWGMDYKSSNIEYRIFAYEFADKESTLRYYVGVTGEEKRLDKIPLNSFDKNILWQKKIGDSKYQIAVIEGNKAYVLISSNLIIDKIDKMLSTVFSVKV